MPRRQPLNLPKIWLMTDPRLGDGLLAAVQRLPAGSGVVFRHYQLGPLERKALYMQVRRICARRGHLLLLAGDPRLARRWSADGVHGRQPGMARCRSVPTHNAREIAQAKRLRADLIFLSPLHATSSHPYSRSLGPARFAQLAKLAFPTRVIALGGMTRAKAALWHGKLVHGWAAIDAFRK
jgi:thiamine-phosphate pyrophosphorylase